jgi:predicted RNA binding protein YcfA (HicA-like mRNA interferase family)
MNPYLPAITGDQVVRALKRAGFYVDRIKGSHYILRRDADRRQVVVPCHRGVVVKRKTLQAILDGAGLTTDEFKDLL